MNESKIYIPPLGNDFRMKPKDLVVCDEYLSMGVCGASEGETRSHELAGVKLCSVRGVASKCPASVPNRDFQNTS